MSINYGEPWKFNLNMDAVPITRADGAEVLGNCEINELDLVRAVTCVNACADIPDPSSSIPYLVTLAKIAQDLAKWSDRQRTIALIFTHKNHNEPHPRITTRTRRNRQWPATYPRDRCGAYWVY